MKIVQGLDAPFPLDHYPMGSSGDPPLPPNEQIFSCITLAFSEALPLWHFVDQEYIQGILSRIWNPSSGFGQNESDKDDFGLLYAVLALGQRFEAGENGPNDRKMQG